jgi:hypothetical protein
MQAVPLGFDPANVITMTVAKSPGGGRGDRRVLPALTER